ncbi:MAG TPA: DUF5916 domain-containing protein, partial [Gemmatimonadota bacterium]|nr:DUF5916 domain-containing protein [Gemmatimonadota bacterium]
FGSPGCMVNCPRGLDLFYSRRIGAAPQGAGLASSAGDYADIPSNTTILGAAKLTGRTEGGTTVGVLDAVTGHETARVATAAGSTFTRPVAPLTNDFVGRVKQDLDEGNLVVGGLFTSVDRRLTDPGLAGLLPSSARAGGADVRYYWGGHDYFFYAALTGSHVTGDSAAMLRLQRSSARYLQRPDRSPTGDGLFTTAYDPGATSMSGYGGILRVAKQGGTWLWDINGSAVSPGFETNDLGFQRKADYLWLNGALARQLTTPTGWYRSLTYGGGVERYWNYEGDITQSDVTGAFILELLNYWQFKAIAQRSLAAYSDRLTRGGPVVRQPGQTMEQLEITSDPRQAVTLHAVGTLGQTDAGGFSRQLELTATWRPSPNVKVSLGPSYSHDVTTDQYVTSVADPTATDFYGRRYVFAHLDEKQLAMETRASITFTPSLSFELYVQPLIASAGFSSFEEFAAPRSEKKLVYGRDVGTIAPAGSGGSGAGTGGSGASPEAYAIDPDGPGPAASFDLPNPNFDRRSLRGTAVLRWQWRPGSTAYLVWTQTRNGRAPFGDLSLNRDLGALGSLPADNTLEVKISYWLGF